MFIQNALKAPIQWGFNVNVYLCSLRLQALFGRLLTDYLLSHRMTIKPFQKTSLIVWISLNMVCLKSLSLLSPACFLPALPPLPSSAPTITSASSALNSTSLKVQGKISRHQSLMQMRRASSLEQLSLLNITQQQLKPLKANHLQ